MGCQVMYVLRCDNVETGRVMDWSAEAQAENGIIEYERPGAIYIVS